jgi:vanillate O-demethylase monooxygenase subunit
MFRFTEMAFHEDKDIIEAQQKVIDLDPTRQMMSLSFDAGPNLFRGIVQQLVEGEIRDPEPIPGPAPAMDLAAAQGN